MRLRDLVRGAARYVPRYPRVASALLNVARADDTRRLSMGAWVERNARRFRDEPALLFEDTRWTWRELNLQGNAWAHTLAELGVRRGDTAALLTESRPELLFALVGLSKLGACGGLVNVTLRGENLAHSLKVVSPTIVLVGEELVGAFGGVRAGIGATAPVYVRDPWSSPSGGVAAPAGWTDAAPLLEAASRGNPRSTRHVTLGDRAFTIPTSGTTGLPKASVMSHMRWIKAADFAGRVALDLHPGDVVYVPLPFFHNMALSIGWGAVVASGAALLMRRKLSVSAFWDDCRRHGVTAFPYIGELPRYLLAAEARPGGDHNPVRAVVGVGMPSDVWEPFARRFGIDQVFEMYSASEANTAFVNAFGIPGSVGFSPGPTALLAWDAERGEPARGQGGRYVKARRGEPGLLISKVTDRYRYDGYTEPGPTEGKLLRGVFRAGDVWFNTGDLLRPLGWGHAAFVDRVGDTFRWRSENVSTQQVERCLLGADGVKAAAVYGVQVPGAPGRAGMAALVLEPGATLDPEGLARRCFEELAEPAVPVFLRLMERLPTTETHKPKKAALRAEGWSSVGGDAIWVRLPRRRSWVPLDAETAAALAGGEVVF